MLTRNLRKLLGVPSTLTMVFLQKRGNIISGPPKRILSTGQRFLHLGFMATCFMVSPVIFFLNIKKIRGIEEEEEDEEEDVHEHDQDD